MENTKADIGLSTVQDWMQKALINADQSMDNYTIAQHVKASARLNPADCLAIYQRSYYARLTHCLQEQYKALCHALGKELFTDFCREYLEKYPSNSPTLSELGARFPQFLEETRPDAQSAEKEPWVEFMIDLAKFEWDLYVMFDAAGNEADGYAAMSEEDNNLQLQNCFALKKYSYPVSAYYQAVAQNKHLDIPPALITHLAISRINFQIKINHLQAPQYFFLQQLEEHKSVDKALEALASKFEKSAVEVAKAWNQWKKEWVALGFFVVLKCSRNNPTGDKIGESC